METMAELKIARYSEEHLPGLRAAALELLQGAAPYPTKLQRAQGVEGFLDLAAGKTLARSVALIDGRVVGHGSYSTPIWKPLEQALSSYPRSFELSRLFVVPSARRRGVSRALLRSMLAEADELRAAVGLSYFTRLSASAAGLYLQEGFELIGGPEDAVAIEAPEEPCQLMVRVPRS